MTLKEAAHTLSLHLGEPSLRRWYCVGEAGDHLVVYYARNFRTEIPSTWEGYEVKSKKTGIPRLN